MPHTNYPFAPKSTTRLERGQFWAIPLSDGTYGAGCIVGKLIFEGKTRARVFLAGVIAWHGNECPTSDALLNCEVYQCASAHIKAILESGGQILGKAKLNLDSFPESADSLSFPAWGYNVPNLLAHQYAGVKK